jgi:WD40 repeat protein
MSSALLPTFEGEISSLILRSFGLRPYHTDGDVLALGFSPEGTLWSVEEPGVLRQWDLQAQKQIDWHPVPDLATQWCFNGTCRLLASGSDNLAVWVGRTGEQLAEWEGDSWVTALAFSPDSQILASGHDDGGVRLWDWSQGHLLHHLRGHEKPISALAFSRDGTRLASAGEDLLIHVWDPALGQDLGLLEGHTDRIPALQWHPDGIRLVSAGWDTTARVWNTQTLKPIILLNSHAVQVFALAFSPEGRLLACADSANAVHVWDFEQQRPLRVLNDLARDTLCLAFSPDGRKLAAGGANRVISIWDAYRHLTTEPGPDAIPSRNMVAISPDAKKIYHLGTGTGLRVWDTTSGANVTDLANAAAVQAFALSRDGHWLAASQLLHEGLETPTLALVDTTSRQSPVSLNGPTQLTTTLAFSGDSSLLATANKQSPDVWLWNVPSGKPYLLVPDGAEHCAIEHVALDRRGHLLAVAGSDELSPAADGGQVVLWDLLERKILARFAGAACQVAFHPSGNSLAGCTRNRTARIWDIRSQTLLHELIGHVDSVNCVAYSPDGLLLATGGDDRTLRIWEATTGNPVIVLELDSQVKALQFAPDGQSIFVANANSSCHQLDVARFF